MAAAYHYPDIGTLGEDFVAQWLTESGWKVLHQRWRRSRIGEVDIIAEIASFSVSSNTTKEITLAFIEVKTRSAGNWDFGGRYTVESRKQKKIWRGAQMFLAEHPEKAEYTCRFDVAIILCSPKSKQKSKRTSSGIREGKNLHSLALQETPDYHLTLQEYIIGAFDSLEDNL